MVSGVHEVMLELQIITTKASLAMLPTPPHHVRTMTGDKIKPGTILLLHTEVELQLC